MAEPPSQGLDSNSVDANSLVPSQTGFSAGSDSTGEWQGGSSMTPADLLGRGAGYLTDHGLGSTLWSTGQPVASGSNEAPVDDWWHEVDVDPDFLDEDDRLRDISTLQTAPSLTEPAQTTSQHNASEQAQNDTSTSIAEAQAYLEQHQPQPQESAPSASSQKPEEDDHMHLHYQVHAAVAEAIKLPEPEPPVDMSGMREHTLDLIREGLQEKNEEIQQINERIKEVEHVLDKLEEVWSNRIFDADIMKSGLDSRRRSRKKRTTASKPLFGRNPEGQYLRMECPSCRRDVFVNSLGFMNHCRIVHKLKFESYEQALSACGIVVDESAVPLDDPCRLDILTPGLLPLPSSSSSGMKPEDSDARSRFYIKKRVIVGSTSKASKNPKTGDIDTKWVVYVRGTKEDPDIGKFIRKVRFFLHPPTFQPHHIVEIHEAPFQITRRGGATFPVRVQLHTIDTKARPTNLTHHLHVEKENTILPTQGEESIVEIDFDRITFDRILNPAPAPSSAPSVPVPTLPPSETDAPQNAITSLDAAAAAAVEEEEDEEDEEEDEDDAFADGESGDEASGDEVNHAPGKLSKKSGTVSSSPLKISENEIMTFIRVQAEKTFPLISEEKYGKLPYSVARTHKEWYSWSLGKRKACEWQRAHRLSQLLLDRLRVHKSTREIIDICHSLQMSPVPATFTGGDDESGGTYEQLYGAPMLLAWAEKAKNPFRKHGTQSVVFCRYCGCTHLPLEKFSELEASCGESKVALLNTFTKWDDFLNTKMPQAAAHMEKRLDEICMRESFVVPVADRRAGPHAVLRAKWSAVERVALQGIRSHTEEPMGEQETAEAIKYEVDEHDYPPNHQPHLTALTAMEELMLQHQQQHRQPRSDLTEVERKAMRATRAAQRRQRDAMDRERRRREPMELRQKLADIEYTKLQLQRKQKELELHQTYLREKVSTGSSAAPAVSALQNLRSASTVPKHVQTVPILHSMPLPPSAAVLGQTQPAAPPVISVPSASSTPATKPVVLAVPGASASSSTSSVVLAVPAASPKRVPGSLLLPKRQMNVRNVDPALSPILSSVIANTSAPLNGPPSTPPPQKQSHLYPAAPSPQFPVTSLVTASGMSSGMVSPPVLRAGGATPALPTTGLFRSPMPGAGQSLLRRPAASPTQALGSSLLSAPRASPQAITELKSLVSNSTPAPTTAPIIPLPNLPAGFVPASPAATSSSSSASHPRPRVPATPPSHQSNFPAASPTSASVPAHEHIHSSSTETATPASSRTHVPQQRRLNRDPAYHYRVALAVDDIQRVRSMVSKIGVNIAEDDASTSEILLYRLMTTFARRLLNESAKAYMQERSQRDPASERELKVLVPLHVAQAISRVPDFDFLRNEGYMDDAPEDPAEPTNLDAMQLDEIHHTAPVLPSDDKDAMDVDQDHTQSVLDLLQQHLDASDQAQPTEPEAGGRPSTDAMQE